MALGRYKTVYARLADIWSEPAYLADRIRKNEVDAAANLGDTIDIMELPEYTVSDGVDSGGALQDGTVNQVGLTGGTLTLDQHPLIIVQLGAKDQAQALQGDLATQAAVSILNQIRREIDRRIVLQFQQTTAYDTSGTYHDNAAAAALGKDTVPTAAGKMQRAGSHGELIDLWIPPESEGKIAALQDFVREAGNDSPMVGGSRIGSLSGYPVIKSRMVKYRRTIASTAWNITSNVLTITVAAGHGVVPGMKLTFDTATAGGDMATATAVSSVTGTTIVLPWTASNGSATEAGTITVESAECLLVDRGNCHAAYQRMPTLRVVPEPKRAADNLQVMALLGFRGRTGNVRVLHMAA